MSKSKNMNDVFELFKDVVSPETVVSAAINSKIASDIIRVRLDRNMTQKEFANAIGVSQCLVSRWESGESNFTINTIAKIVAALDLDVSIAISDKAKSKKNDDTNKKFMNKEFKGTVYKVSYSASKKYRGVSSVKEA